MDTILVYQSLSDRWDGQVLLLLSFLWQTIKLIGIDY